MPLSSGWEAVCAALKTEKTRYVFAPPDFANGLRAAIDREPTLQWIETSQPAQTALGYAQASGEAGICFGTLTAILPAIQQAKAGCLPLLAISLDEADTLADPAGAAKWTYRLSSPAQIPWCLRRAFSLAANGQPGPVLLHLPASIADLVSEIPESQNAQRAIRFSGDLARVIAAAFLLVEAKNPVMLSGHGALLSAAHDDLRLLAELLGMPVITTQLGRGILPEDHPLALGQNGPAASALAAQALQEADLLITVGARDVQMTHNGRVIQIDIDPFEIDRAFTPDLPILGDAKLVLADILSAILSEVQPKPEWQIRGANWAKAKKNSEAAALAACASGGVFSACQAMQVIQHSAGEGTLLVYSSDDPRLPVFAAPFLRASAVGSLLAVASLSTPVADGIQLARAEQMVLCVASHAPEVLPTQPLTWISLQDSGARLSEHKQLARFSAASQAELRQALVSAREANQQGIPAIITLSIAGD